MVDFAAMREAVKTLGGDPKTVHPACPTDLMVDHSLQIDFSKWYFHTCCDASRARRPMPSPLSECVWDGRGGSSGQDPPFSTN